MSAIRRRPTRLTLLALALFCLIASAIGNLLVWRSMQPTAFPPGSPGAGAIQALAGPLNATDAAL